MGTEVLDRDTGVLPFEYVEEDLLSSKMRLKHRRLRPFGAELAPQFIELFLVWCCHIPAVGHNKVLGIGVDGLERAATG